MDCDGCGKIMCDLEYTEVNGGCTGPCKKYCLHYPNPNRDPKKVEFVEDVFLCIDCYNKFKNVDRIPENIMMKVIARRI